MATLTEQEIEQLQQQLKEKTKEVKEIYDKLVEAGSVPIADDFLDTVAGGLGGLFGPPTMPPSIVWKRYDDNIPKGDPRP